MFPNCRAMLPWIATLLALLVSALPPRSLCAADAPPAAIEFNRDIRPLLSEACYQCHGPDSAQRKADLRLDTPEGATADRGGYQAIKPGDAASSALMSRITAADDAERMPPPGAGARLTEAQIALVRRWIDSGAGWQKHWAFLAPQRPALPSVKDAAWPRNAIDHFTLARREEAGLSPAPPADKVTLLRRVTLDLTGLPPTPAEVDAFLADPAPDAYEKVIDRLLASERFGERMAASWLDAARYADTSGYQTDGERVMWRWRDWVIDALNHNMPFDRFTIEQLAGDMLPGATLDQRIATGFNRNHRGNGEGGIIPAEFAVEYVVDRVETTGTVWLGLTVGCARCHDHKYDAITQKEFYQLFAFFNQVPERGKAVKVGNSPPFLKAPTKEQQAQLAALDRDIAATDERLAELRKQLVTTVARWEESHPQLDAGDWSVTRDLQAHFACDSAASEPTLTFADGDAAYVAGRLGSASAFDGRRFAECGDVGDFGYFSRFTITAWVRPDGASDGVLWSRMKDDPDSPGYNVQLVGGKLQVNLIMRWLDDSLRLEAIAPLPQQTWSHVAVSYDGSRVAAGVRLYVDGQEQKLRVLVDELNQSFQSKEPFRIGAGGPAGRFRGDIDELRIYKACLDSDEIEIIATAATPVEIVATPSAGRTVQQARKLQAFYVARLADEGTRAPFESLAALRRQREELFDAVPTTMVMQESSSPRDTFLLVRGRYDQPGEMVSADIPAALAEPQLVEKNRLGFARWLVDPANPLTARVAVNRFWQMFFGTGLVATVDDFGTRGELPSHPQLLDWLATEFQQGGWNIKALQRLIVTSATYRQSSAITPELLRRDPENRLLARGPRQRLAAETIRDQALAAAGLLVNRLGGPSVKPYQPPKLWMELTGTLDYEQSHGDDLYRRSIYTYVKRTAAPPAMITFDSSPRETCSVRVTRTNTPMQALTLMNDVTYVEAARALAERVVSEAGPSVDQRLALAFRLAAARQPTASELQTLAHSWEAQRAHYRQYPEAAALLVKTGEAPLKTSGDVGELAAYTMLASLILNLDETITKE